VKIAISGFQGSGKTTLCHEVIAKLKRQSYHCAFVTESARSSHLLLKQQYTIDMHLEIIGLQLANEMRAVNRSSITVCDRSLLDFLAYADCRGLFESPGYELLNGILEFGKAYLKTYNIIFLMSGTHGNLDHDPARKMGEMASGDFDTSIRRFIDVAGVGDRVLEVPIEGQLEFILDWFESTNGIL
jgi:nicotinamide riboside kinase